MDGEGPFYYPDGSIQDYYTVIEASREAGIVGIIVEHAFLSNKSDSDKLKSEAFLKELGYADAEGIAEDVQALFWVGNRQRPLEAEAGRRYVCYEQLAAGQGVRSTGSGRIRTPSPDGRPLMKSATISTARCALRTDGWLKDDGSWYWLSSSGVMQTGWLEAGWNVVLARSADWQDGNGLDDGFGRTSLLLTDRGPCRRVKRR